MKTNSETPTKIYVAAQLSALGSRIARLLHAWPLMALALALVFGFSPARAAAIVVNSTDDPAGYNVNITLAGLGSTVTLRDAFNAAMNAGGNQTITFDPSLAGQTIVLTHSQHSTANGSAALPINAPGLVIQGLTNGPGITISGGGTVQIFWGVNYGPLTLNDLTLTDGSASWGAALDTASTVVARRCTFYGNAASHNGGAIDVQPGGGNVTLIDCTITGNDGHIDAGAVFNGGVLVLINTTIAGNTGGYLGESGIAGGVDNHGTLIMTNSIVAGNTFVGTPADMKGANVSSASRNNLIGTGGSDGLVNGVNGNIVGVDPNSLNLAPLANNGGPVPTMALQAGSPAIDAGMAIPGINADQRGYQFIRGPDIGAFEYQSPAITNNNAAVFFSGGGNNFQFAAMGIPSSSFSESGSLPPGVTLSASGVLSGIPSIGSEGTYPITVTASNGLLPNDTQNFTLTVQSLASVGLLVTTLTDENNPANGLVSLRQAITNAVSLGGARTIAFDPNLFAGGPATLSLVTNVGSSAYRAIIIQGLGGKLTIAGPGPNLLAISGSRQTALFNLSGTVEFDNLAIANASDSAMISGNNLICSNVVFSGNNAGFYGTGGAIYGLGPLTLINCLFTNNVAGSGGAVFAQNAITVQGCAFVNNQAGINAYWQTNGTGQGGAIYVPLSYNGFSVINSTFVGNQAHGGVGGALGVAESFLPGNAVINCTFTANGADAAGGGIEVITNGTVPLAIKNCIVSGNSAPANAEVDPVGGYGATNSLLGGNTAAIFGGNILGNNGGLTPTLALNFNGPAVNAGNNALLPAGLITDQRGLPRLSAGTVDIGAYEFQLAPPVITSADSTIFLAGLSNRFSFVATGSPPAAIMSASGTLPAGVNFTNGLLSGTPPDGSGGVYSLTITATNGLAPNAAQSFTLNVVEHDVFAARPNFATNGLGWALNGDSVNGGPSITGNVFTLTDGTGGETRSAWFRYPLYVGGFQASFTYQDIGGGGADGTAFVIQQSPAGPGALGAGGGGLGYLGIAPSVALLLNIYAGAPGGSGLLVATNGVGNGAGYWPATYQSAAPVALSGGNPIDVNLRYTGGILHITLQDNVTAAVFQTNVPLDLVSFAGTNTAWVGFTGSEGGVLSHQTVGNFAFTPLPDLNVVGPGLHKLSWPASACGFRLQTTTNLTSGLWQDASAGITQTNNLNEVNISVPSGTQFYRLAL